MIDLSTDGTQITVITPLASLEPLNADTPATIRVTSQYGTGRDQLATLDDGFLYLAEHPTPELFALTPNSGPIEGGTRVTITGAGFQYPVQVFFTIPIYGAIQAQVVSVNFNRIVVIAPSITPMAPPTPTIAQVSAINMETGKISNELTFRYGNAMFISAIAPNEGPDLGGTMVTIFGQGFVAPLTVTLAGVPAQILTVAGTEIVVRANAPTERSCAPITGPVVVTNIDSNLSASGPTFTYRPARPLITSVEVFSPVTTPPGNNIVQEYDPTRTAPCDTNDPYGLYTVVVRGENFEQYPNSTSSAMSVIFTNPDIEVLTTWVSSTEVRFTLPDLSAVVLDTAACTINGAPGLRDIPTGIGFAIKNNNNGCTDELDPAIILNPCDPNCTAGLIQVILSPAALSLAVGNNATMTACISAVQLNPVNITIQRSGSPIVDFTDVDETNANPITLVLAPGDVCESFQVNALSGGTVGVVASLDVSLGGSTDISQITVGALGITLSPAALTLPVGGIGNLTIQLSAPAPPGGAPVLIDQVGPISKIDFGPLPGAPTCTNPPAWPATAACPGGVLTSFTVVIPAGSSTYSFPVNGLSAGGPVTVSGTLHPSLGGAIAISTVVVGQYNVTLSPSTLAIPVGGSATFTVSLDAPAFNFGAGPPICGIQINISQTGPAGVITFTSDPDGPAGVPVGGCGPAGPAGPAATGLLTIPDGAQIGSFTVNGIAGGGPITVTVSLPSGVGGATASSTVTVTTYVITMAPETALLPLGGLANFTVTLNAPTGPDFPVGPPDEGAVRIYLSQVGQIGIIQLLQADGVTPLLGTAPNQYVEIPGGGNFAVGFTVKGLAEGGPITINAVLDPNKGTSTDTSTVTVGTLTLQAAPATIAVPVTGTNTFILTLSKAQTTSTNVNLTSSNNEVAFVWDGASGPPPVPEIAVSIPAFSLSSAPILVYGKNLGLATIYAQLDAALGGSTAQVAVNVTQGIQFIPTALSISTGSIGTFTLKVATAVDTGGPGVDIELDYSGTNGAITGPATVNLPDGTTTASFDVWGLKPTGTTVSIVASMPDTGLPPGLAGATATGTVTVIGAPYTLTFTPSVINLSALANQVVTAKFNYPLPPSTYPAPPLPAGAAFTITLPMNPTGGAVITINGTPAIGNDDISFDGDDPLPSQVDTFIVNGIAAGGPVTITGTVPAFLGGGVATATATVGPGPATLTMDPSPFMWDVNASATETIDVFISPVQGVATVIQLQSSNPAVVQVPASVTIAAGSNTNSFTATVVGVGSATITATLPTPPAPAGVSATEALAAVIATNSVTVFDATLSPATLSLPAGTIGSLLLDVGTTLPQPIVVTVTSATPATVSVPATVTIPVGGSVVIPVTGVNDGGPINVDVDFPAANGGLTVTSAITVTEMPLSLAPATQPLYKGGEVTLTATMGATRVLPTTINLLTSGGGGALVIPASISIPAGSLSTSFTVGSGTATGTKTIAADFAEAGLALAVDPTADVVLTDVTLAFTPASLLMPPNQTVQVTATIPAALAVNLTVALTNTAPGLFTAPASITIPAGSTSIVFDVTSLAGTGGPDDLEATIPAAFTAAAAPQAVLSVEVGALGLTITPLNVGPLYAGGGQLFTLTIDQPQSTAFDITVVSNAQKVTVPASVQMPALATQVSFTAILEETKNTPTQITATLPGSLGGASATATITDVDPLEISASPNNVNIPAATEEEITVTTNITLAKNVTIALASNDPVIVGLFDGASNPAGSLTIPAGSNTGTFRVRGVGLGNGVSVYLDTPADLGGSIAAEEVVTVNVLGLQLQFNEAAYTVAHGDTSPAPDLEAIITDGGGGTITVVIPVTVRITSADPTSVLLRGPGGDPNGASPIDIVIPAGSSSETFRVFGNSPGGPFAVTGALLPPIGNDTAVLQVGVSNPTGAWTFSLSSDEGCTTGGTR